MTITGYLAPRRERPAAPTPVFDQDTKRERRRRWLSVTLDGEFRLDDEVDAICTPLAQRITEQPRPAAFVAEARAVADAVGGLCGTVAGLTADTRLRSLDSVDRARAREALRTVSHEAVPTITADMIADGSWAAALVEIARPHTEALSRLLGRQNDARRGEPTAGDLLIDALRGLDRTALDLDRRIQKAEYWHAQFGDTSPSAVGNDAQTARATLAELGLDTDLNTATIEQENNR